MEEVQWSAQADCNTPEILCGSAISEKMTILCFPAMPTVTHLVLV